MVLPESEAKKRWCPMARVDATASNRPDGFGVSVAQHWPPCVGSDCMMWRQYNGAVGFCGLAGKPYPND